MIDSSETRASAGGARQPRLRLPLSSLADVRREMGRLYRETRAGRVEVSDGSRMANMLQILAKVIEGSELEKRVQALEGAVPRKGRF